MTKLIRDGGHVLLVVLFVVYLVLLAWIVLWKLEAPYVGAAALLPRPIKLIPFLPSAEAGGSAPLEVVANILLFVPFGLYLGLLAPSWQWWKAGGRVRRGEPGPGDHPARAVHRQLRHHRRHRQHRRRPGRARPARPGPPHVPGEDRRVHDQGLPDRDRGLAARDRDLHRLAAALRAAARCHLRDACPVTVGASAAAGRGATRRPPVPRRRTPIATSRAPASSWPRARSASQPGAAGRRRHLDRRRRAGVGRGRRRSASAVLEVPPASAAARIAATAGAEGVEHRPVAGRDLAPLPRPRPRPASRQGGAASAARRVARPDRPCAAARQANAISVPPVDGARRASAIPIARAAAGGSSSATVGASVARAASAARRRSARGRRRRPRRRAG